MFLITATTWLLHTLQVLPLWDKKGLAYLGTVISTLISLPPTMRTSMELLQLNASIFIPVLCVNGQCNFVNITSQEFNST